MKTRTLSLSALVALLGAAAAVFPALSTASEAKLEVNQNCVEPNWPCWATPGSNQPALRVTLALSDKIKFADHAIAPASVSWLGSAPTCSGMPASATTNWEGTCEFERAGTYKFESPTLFKDFYNDYTKYEIVVKGTPTDETTPASEAQTEATLNGSIDPEGNIVEYHFEYEGPGVTGKQSTSTGTLSAADFTNHSVSASVMGLMPGMTYRFLLVATYGSGEPVAGATTQTFTTRAATAPTATTLAAEGLKETEATLKGTVNTGGEATEYFFEYGADAHYGQKTEKATLSASGGNRGVSATLKGLTPGAEYHFRLVVENKQGPGEGLDRSFKTLAPPAQGPAPPAKEPTPTPTPAPGPISPEPEIAPPIGPLVEGSLKLTAPRRGSSVRGSVEVSNAGAGGRLEIDLIAGSASLAAAHRSGPVRVGRFVRASVSAGRVSFSVGLNARARSALRRRHRLALTVKIALVPTHGATVAIARSVALRV